MLTVREALALPVFTGATLVAGEAGLDNQIEWVHTIDIPDAHYDWQRRGVLLLTAGFGLRDSEERQAALVPTLVEQGFAGLVLSVGYYFDKTPEVIRQRADELNFPVIESPYEMLFIDISEAILAQITQMQNRLLRQSHEIHKQLTDLVLRGGDLHDLAATLAQLLSRSVTIESPTFHVLANAEIGPIDEARRRSVANGRTTPQTAQRLLRKGIYAQLLQRMGPMHIPPMPDLDMEMERFVAPIIVDREIYGYMWIISGDRPLTELDELAIDRAATVAALIMLKERAVREAEESLRGDFLEQLLNGRIRSATVMEQAHRFSFRIDRPHQILLIHGAAQAGGSNHDLLATIRGWLQSYQAYPLVVARDELTVVVLEGEDPALGKQFGSAIVHEISHPSNPLLVGVGRPFTLKDEPEGIRRSYEEAQEALRVGQALHDEGVIVFDDLGVLHWLFQLTPEQRRQNAYMQRIRILTTYDRERNTELLKTLEAYLDRGGSLVDTAQSLYIHRNTLLHRLERIRELCGIDLRDPWHQLNLHVAVKAYRLHRSA